MESEPFCYCDYLLVVSWNDGYQMAVFFQRFDSGVYQLTDKSYFVGPSFDFKMDLVSVEKRNASI